MTMCPQEYARLVKPRAGITVTVTVVLSRAEALVAHEIDRCFQCANEIWQGRFGRRRIAILIQPATCRTEIAAATMTILGAEIALQAAICEVDFPIDQPAWIFE
jgi:hypothetical protein